MANVMEVDPAMAVNSSTKLDEAVARVNAAANKFANACASAGFKGDIATALIGAGDRVNSATKSFNAHTSDRVDGMRQLSKSTIESASDSSGQLNNIELPL